MLWVSVAWGPQRQLHVLALGVGIYGVMWILDRN